MPPEQGSVSYTFNMTDQQWELSVYPDSPSKT
jgi:hypothetical protein